HSPDNRITLPPPSLPAPQQPLSSAGGAARSNFCNDTIQRVPSAAISRWIPFNSSARSAREPLVAPPAERLNSAGAERTPYCNIKA
ncbi:jg24248, partial [Pararge aegeria aegeria]